MYVSGKNILICACSPDASLLILLSSVSQSIAFVIYIRNCAPKSCPSCRNSSFLISMTSPGW